MKKTVIVVSIILLITGVLFAGGQKESTAKGEEKIKIALINPFVRTAYQPAVNEAAEAKAKEMGADFTLFDAEFSGDKMYDQAVACVNQEYDGVIIVPFDKPSSEKTIKLLHEAGIPVIPAIADTTEEGRKLSASYVAANMYKQGQTMGNFVAELYEGEECNVVTIQGSKGNAAAMDRQQGFIDAATKNPGVEILADQSADWNKEKALEIMENYLVSYPKIDVVFAHDDVMASGAIEAIKASGREGIRVFGVGANTEGLNNIREGYMYATVTQQPEVEGANAAETLIKYIRGEDVPDWVETKREIVTAENVDNYSAKW